MSQIQKGVVKWFDNAKGYGFIQVDGTERDIFVHYSSIEGAGYRSLQEGAQVEFTLQEGDKGPQAKDVRVL